MENFVTDCKHKTPAMLVKVFDQSLHFKRKYTAPPGFQLEKYVLSLHPRSSLCIRLLAEDFCVDIYEENEFLGRYLGIYEKS
jgi:hypothetical protein